MRKTNKQLKIISGLLIFIALVLSINYSFAAIIKDENGNPVSWSDNERAKDAYRPSPILFIHGFASGGPLETWVERVNQKEDLKPNLDKKLERYFKYYTGYSKDPTILEKTRFPYLELISYIDFTQSKRSQLIDRNSSVDTYQKGDYYVKTKERLIGTLGWSDKLEKAIQELRENYKDKYGYPLKIILVCHSMGGLSAREYLTNPKYSYSLSEVEKLILIGVPNLGSPFAKLANGLTRAQRVGWFIPGGGWIFSSLIEGFDMIVEQKGQIDIDGDAVRDMDPTKRGSGFLTLLNGRIQPQNVDYFAIWGNGDILSDILVSRQLYQGEGDGVVSKDSQLGTGVLNLKDSLQIAASHGTEPLVIANDDAKPLLKFIDYTKPEVNIISPDPNAKPITEIKTLSINLKGAVSKEYLPADSILKITTERQEDGEIRVVKEDKLLYPSDQWVPNDPNSIRAEFDEIITFSGNGTYKISCQVTNPTGLTSDIKEVWVKVTVSQDAGIIVHCHNPEGVEIASIQGMSQNNVEIYDGNTLIGYGAYNTETHNKPIKISSGSHTIKAKFNGMTKEQNITVNPNEAKEVIFTFERTVFNHREYVTNFNRVDYNSISFGPGQIGFGMYGYSYAEQNQGLLPFDDRILPNSFLNDISYRIESQNCEGTGYFESIFRVDSGGAELELNASIDANEIYPPNPPYEPIANIGSRWFIEIQAINGAAHVIQDIPELINVNFSNWIVQWGSSASPDGPQPPVGCALALYDGGNTPLVTLTNLPYNYYRLDFISAAKNYLGIVTLGSASCQAWGYTIKGEYQRIKIIAKGEFVNDQVYVSSVPYDLTGSGI